MFNTAFNSLIILANDNGLKIVKIQLSQGDSELQNACHGVKTHMLVTVSSNAPRVML